MGTYATSVAQLFLLLVSYVLGNVMAKVIPTWGWFRYLNPGPFNSTSMDSHPPSRINAYVCTARQSRSTQVRPSLDECK